MLEKIIELAKQEVGNDCEKYEKAIFPGKRPMTTCLTFIIWLFVQVYGEAEAKKKLYMQDDEFTRSIAAFVTFVKGNNKYHFRSYKPGYIIFLKTTYEWTNHLGIIIDKADGEITTVEGNVNGKVAIGHYKYNDMKISGYGEIEY